MIWAYLFWACVLGPPILAWLNMPPVPKEQRRREKRERAEYHARLLREWDEEQERKREAQRQRNLLLPWWQIT